MTRRNVPKRLQRGLSIVEMMVGVTIGMIVVAAATLMVAGQLTDNRRLLLETQIQQDMRTAADLITRDLRRAGFWQDSPRGTVSGSGTGMLVNPYTEVLPANDGDTDTAVTYRYAHPNRPVDDNIVNDDEVYGFRLRNGVIESQLGRGNWQALTDAGALKVTRFQVAASHQAVPLTCFRACGPGATVCPPVQTVRAYTVEIEGEAANDATVARSVRSHVRLRNDLVVGECRD